MQKVITHWLTRLPKEEADVLKEIRDFVEIATEQTTSENLEDGLQTLKDLIVALSSQNRSTYKEHMSPLAQSLSEPQRLLFLGLAILFTKVRRASSINQLIEALSAQQLETETIKARRTQIQTKRRVRVLLKGSFDCSVEGTQLAEKIDISSWLPSKAMKNPNLELEVKESLRLALKGDYQSIEKIKTLTQKLFTKSIESTKPILKRLIRVLSPAERALFLGTATVYASNLRKPSFAEFLSLTAQQEKKTEAAIQRATGQTQRSVNAALPFSRRPVSK